MKSKKIASCSFIIAAIGLYLLSSRVSSELASNQKRLNQAQNKIDSQRPELIERPRNRIKDYSTKESIEKNIDEGQMRIAEYTQFVRWMQAASGACLLLGIGLGISSFKQAKNK
ncbi:MAG: hypothetical protein WCG14_01075 [Chlamydiia bacterium]